MPPAPSDRIVARSRLSVIVLAGVLAVLATMGIATGAPARAQVATGAFTAEERTRLERGQLVSRPHVPSAREDWLGGVSFEVIERPPAEVWRALGDVPAYRHMLPGTDLARDDGLEGGARLVFIRQSSMGFTASYWLHMRANDVTRSVSFELDRNRPHDVAEARGFLEVQSYPGQPRRTLVSWGVRTVLGGGALEGMLRDIIEPWLLRVPSTIKSYLGGSPAGRYRG